MITSAYVRHMARYNTWQNSQIMGVVQRMDDDAVKEDRGAFFGSILGTLNHLLWGDRMWMSRWSDDVARPEQPITETTDITPTISAWQGAREDLDRSITAWADGLSDRDLQGDLSWYSGATGQDQSKPMWLCVTHMFNHQTHHRGQVHAMLTAAGHAAPVSDLVFMPETD